MHRMILLATILAVPACLPYSAGVGQTAASLPTGSTEVGATVGVGYQRITDPETEPADENETTSQLALPRAEANVLHGLSDTIGLNVHLSDAGLQPGVKIGLIAEGPVQVAVMPALAFGMHTSSEEDDSSLISVLAGARVLASMASGPYGAVGYDFQWLEEHHDDPG